MRIDITSFFFNTTIPGATATAAWGTSAGQSKLDGYKIKTETYGLVDLLIGMNYKICSDLENLDISKMSKNRELLFFSIFDKVFINGMKVTNSFIILFVKEHSETHNGRLIISYPPYVTYDNKKVDNNKTIKEFENKLGVNNGSWFVYDISVLNQDELHFSAIVVDPNKSMTYKSSKDRGEIWKDLIDEKDLIIKFLILHLFLQEVLIKLFSSAHQVQAKALRLKIELKDTQKPVQPSTLKLIIIHLLEVTSL